MPVCAQALMNGVPLPSKQLSGDEFEELVLMEVMRNTQVSGGVVWLRLRGSNIAGR